MQIFVTAPSGETVHLDVESHDTVIVKADGSIELVRAKMTVTLVWLSGQEMELELESCMTVAQLLKAAVPEGEPLRRTRLLLGTEELRGDRSLAEQGVKSGARLGLVQSQRHGILIGRGSTAELWCMDTADCLRLFVGHVRDVTDVASDGQQAVLTASEDGTAKLWCLSSGGCTQTFAGHDWTVQTACFSPSAREVLTAAWDAAKLWSRATGACLLTLRHDLGLQPSRRALFSPQGQQLLTFGDGSVELWSKAGGEGLQSFGADAVCAPAFLQGGEELFINPMDGDPMVCCVFTGQRRLILEGHGEAVACTALSPDGGQLATGCVDGTVKLWSSSAGECLRTLMHGGGVSMVAFSPDGQQLLTANFHFVRLWVAADGECLLTLRVHSDVTSAVFGPDGQQFLVRFEDGSTKVWASASGRCLMTVSDEIDEDLPVSAADFLR